MIIADVQPWWKTANQVIIADVQPWWKTANQVIIAGLTRGDVGERTTHRDHDP